MLLLLYSERLLLHLSLRYYSQCKSAIAPLSLYVCTVVYVCSVCWYVKESLSVCFCANLILISLQRGSSGSLDQVGKKSEALGKKGLSRSLSVNDK